MSPSMLDVPHRLIETMHEMIPLDLYPMGVLPIPTTRIGGTAFFPGGSGLWLQGPDPASAGFPFGGIMTLGQSFDSETGFGKSVRRGKERQTSGTWGPLVRLLWAAGADLQECFFTNAFMGLSAGDYVFGHKERNDQPFRSGCVTFLRHQIEVQRPRVILTLGSYVLVCEASENCSVWKKSKLRLRDLDACPVVEGLPFRMTDGSFH
ncbi:MAG: hypothetical protein JWN34_1629 [Bryobacterales bacterium]|nr:hypothetical protein [Bryobacterales bacterium]